MAEITSLNVVSVLCYNHKVIMVLSLDARIYLKGFSALNKERHKGRKFQTHTHFVDVKSLIARSTHKCV